MSLEVKDGIATIADFVASATVGDDARGRAAAAFKDTIGVMLAGTSEPAARIAQSMAAEDGVGECRILGTSTKTSPGLAALANGVAAHSLDYDDMCFVSLAHPSCALVPSVLAVGELIRARPVALLDAYVIGFEIECRLGNVMNPRHYHRRGWHCTSSIGTLGAAAAAARVPRPRRTLRAARARHRRLVGVRTQGKHRQHGQAAACRAWPRAMA